MMALKHPDPSDEQGDVVERLEASLELMTARLKKHTFWTIVLINVPSIFAAGAIGFAAGLS